MLGELEFSLGIDWEIVHTFSVHAILIVVVNIHSISALLGLILVVVVVGILGIDFFECHFSIFLTEL